MKYIDKFATLDDFLTSTLAQMSGDRIATVEGYELPILKKKMKTVITIDPSTNQEVETEELQDVWMVPVGQVEKKVEHNFEVLPYKKIFYFTTGSGVKDYTLAFTPEDINSVFRDNNVSLRLDYSKVSGGKNWDAAAIGDFTAEKSGSTYAILYSNLKTAVYPTDGQTVDVPFFLNYDGSWKEFLCHATFEEFNPSNVVVNNHMTLTPSSTIEIGNTVAVGNDKIVKSTGNNDIDKFYVTDVSVSTAQGNDPLTYNSQNITIPNTQYSSGYDIEGTIHLTPYILDDALYSGSAAGGNNITMPLSMHLNVKASGDIPFEFESFDASVTYSNTVEPNEQITLELDLNETYDRDLTSYTVTGNSNYISYSGTTGGKVNVTMTVPSDLTEGQHTISDTVNISNSRGYSFDFAVTYSIEVAQSCQEYIDFASLTNDNNYYAGDVPNTGQVELPTGIALGCAGTSLSNIYDDDIEFVSVQCYNYSTSQNESDPNVAFAQMEGDPWTFYLNPVSSGSGNYRYDLTFRLKSDNSITGIWSFDYEWNACTPSVQCYSRTIYNAPTSGSFTLTSNLVIGSDTCSYSDVCLYDTALESGYTPVLYERDEMTLEDTLVSDPNMTFSVAQDGSDIDVSWSGLDNGKTYMCYISLVAASGGSYDGLNIDNNFEFILHTKPAQTVPTVTISSNEPDRSQDGEGYRGDTTIQSVAVSSGVTSIGESAFNGCSSLTDVTLPNTLEYLGIGAFLGTSIWSIQLPESLTGSDSQNVGVLGYGTFMNCSSLTSVYIPDSISHIGRMCFSNCPNLLSVELPYGCTYDNMAFDAHCNITYRQAPSE